jgi:hypothetical protein
VKKTRLEQIAESISDSGEGENQGEKYKLIQISGTWV